MKRKSLLEVAMSEEKNVALALKGVMAADAKFFKRTVRDLEDKLEDFEEKLQIRLSSDLAIDKSVVEGLYGEIQDIRATMELYSSFEQEFLQ